MKITPGTEWVEQFGLNERHPPEFFRRIEDIDSVVPVPPQAHAMRRAWQDMSLDGILCLDNVPTVYFKQVPSVSAAELRKLHRKLWNQGIAPILVIITTTDVYVYSGLTLPAKDDENIDDSHRLVMALDRVTKAIEIRQFVRTVELGELFENYGQSFNPKLRVDRYLLRNLAAVRNILVEKSQGKIDHLIVHALLGRLVFTCYLIDRKIIEQPYLDGVGAEGCERISDILSNYRPNQAKRLLYALFEQLQVDFNGDIFDGDLRAERDLIKPEDIITLERFFCGEDLETGQLSLGFWAYDFSVIPIETISAIYEGFLNAEDPTGKRESGAYYTPRFLAEVVLDMALEGWPSLLNKRYLDPACGSGIFLVGIFNRIAEEWRRNNREARYDKRFAALVNIIKGNIFGVDSNETACRIAAFSLYLALLDQLKPRSIQDLQKRGKILPKLVAYRGEPADPEAGNNILCRNFFDENLPLPFEEDSTLPADGFDLILGNPPWARSAEKQSHVKKWGKGLPTAQNQLAHNFVLKAPCHLRDGGQVCFLLPAGILFNHQDKALEFQRTWLSTHVVDKVLNLSDMSFYLFDSAIRPAIVARYWKQRPNKQKHLIEYLSPKTEYKTLKAEVLVISPDDRMQVKLSDILSDLQHGRAATTWKRNFWGTARDNELLDRLSLFPPLSQLAGGPKENKRWVIAQGFQPMGPNDDIARSKRRPWADKQLFLDAKNKNIDLILLESDCTPTGDRFRQLRRSPEAKEIFCDPHVIVSQGLRVAYAGFEVYFRHALQGIHGPEADTKLLMFLAAYLNSALAHYFLFHTTANWGIERDKVHESELLRLPFPLPESAPSSQAREVINEVAARMSSLKNSLENNLLNPPNIVGQAKEDLLPYVYQYFDVSEFEQILIEDTINISIPSSTPTRGARRIPSLHKSTQDERMDFVKLLCDVFNGWTERSKYKLTGNTIVSPKTGAGIVVLKRSAGSKNGAEPFEQNSTQELDQTLDRIISLTSTKQSSVAYLQDLKVFGHDELYILKPLNRRFWTKTSALNDADEIASAILTGNHGKVTQS